MSLLHCGNGHPHRCNGYQGPLDTVPCERHELLRQVERVRALADEMERQTAGSHDDDDYAYRDAAVRIRAALEAR